jgi:hypothetical protein
MSVSHLASSMRFSKNSGKVEISRMPRLVVGFVIVVALTAFIKLVEMWARNYLEVNQEAICDQIWLSENRAVR